MKRIESRIVRISRLAIGVSFALLIVVVLIQVVGRTLGNSPIWTEELTRYCLLYLAAIGAGLSFRSGDLVNVDLVFKLVGKTGAKRLRLVSALITALLCLLLLLPAWRYVMIGTLQTSPAMGLQMTYIHFAAFAMLAILFVFAALRIVSIISGNDHSKDTP